MNDVLDNATMSKRRLVPDIKLVNLTKLVQETVEILMLQAKCRK